MGSATEKDGVNEQQLDTGSVKVNYAVTGQAGAPVLLLLHGITHRWQIFESLLPDLASSHQVFAMDLRGHGESGRVTNGYRAVDYAEEVLDLVRAEVDGRVILIGHSLGALAALQAAARLGKLCRALILIEPPLIHFLGGFKGSPWAEYFISLYELLQSSNSEEEIREGIRQEMPEAPAEVVGRIAARFARLDPEALRVLLSSEFTEGYDLVGALKAIQCPLLLIQSDPDINSAMTAEDATLIAEYVPLCQHKVIQGSAHTVHVSHPEEVLRGLREFLKSSDLGL